MSTKLRNKLKLKQVRYLLVGGSSAAIEYTVFMGLFFATYHVVIANTISFVAGLVYSFCLHKVWSFAGDHKHKTRHQFFGYTGLALINILLSNLIIAGLVDRLDVIAGIAKVITMAMIVAWNFILLNKLIFRREVVN